MIVNYIMIQKWIHLRLLFYIIKNCHQIDHPNNIISIDPGEKTFLTGLTQKNIYKI